MLLHFFSFKRLQGDLTFKIDVHALSVRMKAEKNAFLMVQMWLTDAQLSGGQSDIVSSTFEAFGSLFQHY